MSRSEFEPSPQPLPLGTGRSARFEANLAGQLLNATAPLAELFGCASFPELLSLCGGGGVCSWLQPVVAATSPSGYCEEFEVPASNAAGEAIWISIHVEPVPDSSGGMSLRGSVRDVTARKRREWELERLAHRDPLTGLFNRSRFIDALNNLCGATGGNGPFAVLFVDLDRFKEINDSLGHQTGDALLQNVAARLDRFAGPDDVLARYGGDEFVLLVRNTDTPGAQQLAVSIIEEFAGAAQIGRYRLACTASIGAAIGMAGSSIAEEVLRDADLAMYRSKSEGRNRFVLFDPVAEQETLERLALERELRVAIAEGALHLEYQPVVSLRTGRVIALEARICWEHPVRGTVPPSSFLPVADESDLGGALQEWAIQTACLDARSWSVVPQLRGAVRVSVPVSLRHFSARGVAAVVERALSRAGLAADQLCLQLSESSLVRQSDEGVDVLRSLRQSGVHLMLDDFGSGQSSFTSVLALPVDSARVDTASSQGLDGRPELLKVLNALAALGHALDLSVSAQGISTLGQLTALRGLDFDAVQGDFVAPVRNTVGIARLLAMEARLAERSSALAAEFAGRVSVETVDRLLFESLPQLAAAITNSDSDLVEGFVRRRLEALVGGPRGAVAGSKLVLFVCVHNAGRSQMAAAITAARGRGRVRAESAGSRPADQINPSVRQAMVEIGIQLDTCFPKPLSLELVHAADIIVTMGCGDACPVFPGKRYLDWKLADPAGGTVETARLIRDQVAKYVDELLADLDQTPDAD